MNGHMDEGVEHSDEPRSEWSTDPLTNYSVGSDDAGNIVMHAIGFVVSGWRWLVAKIAR